MRQRGQGAVELVVGVPLILLMALVAWQVAAVMWAGVRAEEGARRAAFAATGASGRVVVVTHAVTVPGPLADGATLRVRARVAP